MAFCTRHKYTDLYLGIYRELIASRRSLAIAIGLIASRRSLAIGIVFDADLSEGHSVQSKTSANYSGLSQGPDFSR